ncbi:hypothetical protein HanXRQr2_Chr15g0714021 [Helianthus annuus]|uniref:Uncharacterized protein n=1 Tax=Helianthus annuus TaxID=4232 RepID=A0A9K3E3T8_HELAN|nr:hypothetical protein HanXRQr2_Chr15g0714021 [Helianthus annuus]KAJ0833000.1 hypothetical protein HanPSC8_Chr15g0685201 [Helianthus annuus]
MSNLESAGVTGTGPVRLLAETLKAWRTVRLRAGMEPVNRFHSSRRIMSLSR